MYTVLPALQAPTGLLSVLATLGPKVSTGASAPTVLITSLNVTAIEKGLPAPVSDSLSSKSAATTLTTVGLTVSTAWLACSAAMLVLPAASIAAAPAMSTVIGAVELFAARTLNVYTRPLPLKLSATSWPPAMLRSFAPNVVTASLNVTV